MVRYTLCDDDDAALPHFVMPALRVLIRCCYVYEAAASATLALHDVAPAVRGVAKSRRQQWKIGKSYIVKRGIVS